MTVELNELTVGESKYRYLYTLSRLDGNSLNLTREDGEKDMVLIQESRANGGYKINPLTSEDVTNEWEKRDYTESFPLKEISKEYSNDITLQIRPDNKHWTHVSIYRTLNINAPEADLDIVGNTFVWVEDIPLVKFGILKYITSRTINDKMSSVYLQIKSKTFGRHSVGETIYFYDTDGNSTGASAVVQKLIDINVAEESFFYMCRMTTTDIALVEIDGWVRTINESTVLEGNRTEKYTNAFELDGISIDPNLGNFQVVWEDGKTSMTTSNFSGNAYWGKDLEIPSKLEGTGNFKFEILGGGGGSGEELVYNLSFKDSVSDDILNGRIESSSTISQSPLFILQTRFFETLPSCSISAVKAAAYFCSTGDKAYRWCQIEPVYRAGYFNRAFQQVELSEGDITRMANYPDSVIIFGRHFTKTINVSISNNAGDERLGEYILSFFPAQLITDKIGCIENVKQAKIDKQEIIFTNEPAVRFFDGYQFHDDMSHNLIRRNVIQKMKSRVFLHWNPTRGLIVYGAKDVQAPSFSYDIPE